MKRQTGQTQSGRLPAAPPLRSARLSELSGPGSAVRAVLSQLGEGRKRRGGRGGGGLAGFEDSAPALFSLRALTTLSDRRPSLRAGLRCAPVGLKVSVGLDRTGLDRTGSDRTGTLLQGFNLCQFVCLFFSFLLEALASAEAAAGACAAPRRHAASLCGRNPLRAPGLDRSSSSVPGYSLVL